MIIVFDMESLNWTPQCLLTIQKTDPGSTKAYQHIQKDPSGHQTVILAKKR